MEKLLEQVFPICGVEDDCLISQKGDVTIGFKIQLPELFMLTGDEYEQLHQSWVNALKVLPTGSRIHKQDYFLARQFTSTPDPSKSFLQRSSDAFFEGRPYLHHHCYVFLTRPSKQKKGGAYHLNSVFQTHLGPLTRLDKKELTEFLAQAWQFKRLLEDHPLLTLKQLKAADYSSIGQRPGLLERYFYLESNDALIRDVQMKPSLQIGGQRLALYSLGDAKLWPAACAPSRRLERYSTEVSQVSAGFVSPLAQLLPCNHIYNQYLEIEDTARVVAKLEQKRLRMRALSAHSRENLLASESIDAFLQETIARQAQPVRAHFNLLIWASTEAGLSQAQEQTVAALSGMNVVAKQESIAAPQLFWAGIPGNATDLPRQETFQTLLEPAVCLLNMEGESRESTLPLGLRLGERLSGKPLTINLNEEPKAKGLTGNDNKFILGPSGSGKSFFTNHLIRSYFDAGAHLVLIDVGDSYQGLCALLKGYYFAYEDDKPFRFNPFLLSKEMIQEGTYDMEKREFLKTLLITLWKSPHESHTMQEYTGLSDAIRLYGMEMAESLEYPCFDSFYEYLSSDYAKEKFHSAFFNLYDFLYVLRPYYKGGEFDYLLNAREQVDVLSQPFIVFELDRIKGAHVMAA